MSGDYRVFTPQREHSSYWSRRIDEKNRLVYRVASDEIVIVQCRYHYGER